MEIFYEKAFFGLLALLISVVTILVRFFIKTRDQNSQLVENRIKDTLEEYLERKLDNIKNNIKDELEHLLKREIDLVKEKVINEMKDEKNHLLSNVKNIANITTELMDRKYNKIEELGNKYYNLLKNDK